LAAVLLVAAAVVAVLRALRLVAAAVVRQAHLAYKAQHLLLPALVLVLAQLVLEAELPLPAQLLAPADLVVLVAAVPLQHLLSRQSFSAAMARISPSPGQATYEPVPRSR